MKLEDLSKDELIHIVRNRCIHMNDIEFDVLTYRADKRWQESMRCEKEANDLLSEYIRLLRPYDGKPIGEVPDAIISKASEAAKKRDLCIKKARRKDAEYNSIQKRIDALLDYTEG